jgi:signal transduction histidine kinase/ABC-type amino acid transport substrate-binding protein
MKYTSCSSLFKALLVLGLLACSCLSLSAAGKDSVRVYTEEHPLIYEDAWDLWPYVFLNENGEAVGYNVDLLKMIFQELDIPYVIKLKPTKEALEDLKAGHCDLKIGMEDHLHDDYATYGKSVIQIFTHSVLRRKDDPQIINTYEDLANHRVIVHGGSFSHMFMVQRGWGNNAIIYDDMREAVQFVHNNPDTRIVWNTICLKWLIQKFQYDDLELKPVNVPHGEYKFMMHDLNLLHKMDSVYSGLNASGRLQAIQNKWFYPERTESGVPTWIWQAILVMLLLTLFFLGYYFVYRRYEKKMTKDIRQSNDRLSLILKTSHVRFFLYTLKNRTITRFDSNGRLEAEGILPYVFIQPLKEEYHTPVIDALQQVGRQEQEKVTLDVQSRPNSHLGHRYFTLEISVLHCDKNGHPEVLIGTLSDVTDEKLRQQEVKDTMLRYQSIFESSMVDTVAYDENGVIIGMNQKAMSAFKGNFDKVLQSHITLKDVLGKDDVDTENIDYTYLTQIFKGPDDRALNKFLQRPELLYELQLVPVRDDDGKLQAVYGTGRDVTEMAKNYNLLRQNVAQLEKANVQMRTYMRNIDFVLQNGGVRMTDYSPDTHMLVIYSKIGRVQYRFTQTRCLSLLDDESKKEAQRGLNAMDNRSPQPVDVTLKTTLRIKDGKTLCLHLSFIPVLGTDGEVTSYFGMCRDISELRAMEEALALETSKAQEVETVKNAFLHNMSYEIRTPLNSVVGFADLFEQEHTKEDEELFIREIRDNSELLLALINDILFLSRLDAHMIELKPQMTDFCTNFETHCQTIIFRNRQPGVDYSIENPYEHLVVEIDEQNLGIAIDQLLSYAAFFTTEGQVRIRCDYTGEDLLIALHASKGVVPEHILPHIFDRFIQTRRHGTGLELSICNELIHQMGGKIRIKSDATTGTIVWMSVPCKCSELVRK